MSIRDQSYKQNISLKTLLLNLGYDHFAPLGRGPFRSHKDYNCCHLQSQLSWCVTATFTALSYQGHHLCLPVLLPVPLKFLLCQWSQKTFAFEGTSVVWGSHQDQEFLIKKLLMKYNWARKMCMTFLMSNFIMLIMFNIIDLVIGCFIVVWDMRVCPSPKAYFIMIVSRQVSFNAL